MATTTTTRRRTTTPKPAVVERPTPPPAQLVELLAPSSPTAARERTIAEAVGIARQAGATSARALRTLAEALIDLRLDLDDMDGRTQPYREARHRAFAAGGVTTNDESARLERNVRYHIGEALVDRGLRPRVASRAGERAGATASDLARSALRRVRRVRTALDAGRVGDEIELEDALDEIEGAVGQIRRRLEAEG